MMRKTHRAFSGAFWLGTTLGVNALALKSGYDTPVHPVIVAAGLFVAPIFSAGKTSPDIDHQWAPGPPRRNYDWKGHRGFTHRFWFASLLTGAAGMLGAFLYARGMPLDAVGIIAAPVNGWWSHIFGDMIFGRIKFGLWSFKLGRFWHWNLGLGWETNGLAEKGGKMWRDPAAQVSTFAAAGLAAGHLVLLVQVYG